MTKLILISLNLSTENSWETKKIIFLALLITEIEMVSSGQATLTNKVNGACDKANLHFIELVHSKLKKRWKQIKNNLSSISASILVVDIADNCIFWLGGVTLGQSGWSTSEHIVMHVFGKVVSHGPFGTPGRSTSPSNDFYTKNLKNRLWGLFRTPGWPCEC